MTSIEWLVEQINKHWDNKNINSDELIKQAKEMHKQEMATNCSQQEISDEKIEKAAADYDNGVLYGPPLIHFEQGAFWYREQLKQR